MSELEAAVEAWLDAPSGDAETNHRLAEALTMRVCECDRFLHADKACDLQAEDHVVSSPALCTRCLFYCWADV